MAMAPSVGHQGDLFEPQDTTKDGRPVPKVQVLSFGAGQDSTALLEMWLGEEAFRSRWPAEHMIVAFSDTGDEHMATYRHLERQQERLQGQDGIELAWITPDMGYHRDSWPSLTEHWDRTNTIGSKKMPKSCSENLKSSVVYKYLDDRIGEMFGFESGRKNALYQYRERYGPVPVMLGIAAGEEDRAKGNDTGPLWMQRTVHRTYPLIELGMDRADCQQKIREMGGTVPRPSLCRRCPFKREADLLLMEKNQPEVLKEWIRLEQQKLDAWEEECQDRGIENSTVWGDGRTLEEVLQDARDKYADASMTEIEEKAFSEGHCVATTY